VDYNVFTREAIEFDRELMTTWGFNTLRLPLRDVHMIQNPQYRATIDMIVSMYMEHNFVIILDLHTQNQNPYQDNFMIRNVGNDALTFWTMVADFYKQPTILFELFNEPHDIDPTTWWYGNDQYYGYKEILTAIRETSSNICILNGLDYAYQWSWIDRPEYATILHELQSFENIVLSSHPYGYRGKPSDDGIASQQIPYWIKYPDPTQSIGTCDKGITIASVDKSDYGWTESFGFLHRQKRFPIIATEWGLDSYDRAVQGGWYSTNLLNYLHANEMGYVAWAWVQDRIDYPSLLDNNFKPLGGGCGTIDNNWYPGPGKLVFQDLYNHSLYEHKKRFIPLYYKVHHTSFINFVPRGCTIVFLLCLAWRRYTKTRSKQTFL
jgi:hypothetical protein